VINALVGIGWAMLLLAATVVIYWTWGNAQLVAMFPEGHRWWMPWARLLALAIFAAVAIFNPFLQWTVHP
jgi:hypothetical protein